MLYPTDTFLSLPYFIQSQNSTPQILMYSKDILVFQTDYSLLRDGTLLFINLFISQRNHGSLTYSSYLVYTQSNLYFKDTSKERTVPQLRQDLLAKSFPYSHIFLHSLTFSQLGVFPIKSPELLQVFLATSLSLFSFLHHQQAGRLGTRTTTQSATSLASSSPFGYIKTIFRLLPKNLNILKIINCG